MLVNAVVQMQWVAPHNLAQPDLQVQRRVWPAAYLNIEALKLPSCTLEAKRFIIITIITRLPALLFEKPLNRN